MHKKIQPQIGFRDNLTIKIEKFNNLNIDSVDFLVLDVQGFELEVLKGFSHKLKNVKFVFAEVNRDQLYEDNVLVRDLDKYLKNYEFIRIWTSWRPADMPWGDAFYIKKDYLNIFQSTMKKISNLLFTNKLFFFPTQHALPEVVQINKLCQHCIDQKFLTLDQNELQLEQV